MAAASFSWAGPRGSSAGLLLEEGGESAPARATPSLRLRAVAAQAANRASGAARAFRARSRIWSTVASFCLICRAMRYTAASQIAWQSRLARLLVSYSLAKRRARDLQMHNDVLVLRPPRPEPPTRRSRPIIFKQLRGAASQTTSCCRTRRAACLGAPLIVSDQHIGRKNAAAESRL